MKTKIFGRVIAAISAVALCLGLTFSVSAAETSVYASTDYANKQELFDAVMSEQGANDTIVFPAPEGYVEGETERVKFIVDGALIAEKYSSKKFVMPFCGVDLTFDGSFLASIGGKRIEIQIEKKEPILLQYTCPKCATTEKVDADGNGTGAYYTPFEGDLSKYTAVDGSTTQYTCPRCKSTFDLSEAGEPDHNEVVTGGITVIETDKHPVVGNYVYELNIYSDNKAISDFGDKDSGIKATIKLGAEALSSVKSVNSKAVFNVYAYMSQSKIYDNMGAEIDEANGTATFQVQDRGWFFLAGDDPSDVVINDQQLMAKLIPIIIIAAVVVIAGVVILVVVLNKKKASAE